MLLLLMLPATAQAQFNYTVDQGKVTITKYTGPGGAVSIPDTIDSLPVTSIGREAFAGCSSLTSIAIPDSVTIIGESTFFGCTGLTSVTIGNGVTIIGDLAFCGCASLTSITIPHGTTSICSGAFLGCSSLTAIIVHPLNGVFSSADGVLFNSEQTELIRCPPGRVGAYTIPNTVTRIQGLGCMWYFREGAFAGCASLTSITIPDSVTSIEVDAFSGCSSLTAIIVHPLNGVFSSADGVLFNSEQTGLIRCPPGRVGAYTIPNTVTWIEGLACDWFCVGWGAFAGCASLTSITIPDSVTNIGMFSLSGCSSLTSVTIGNGVTSIGDGAFYGCSSLTSITIPDSVTSIGYYAFDGCTSLMSAYFEGPPPVIGWWNPGYCPALISFYRPGTPGWGPTFGGQWTALWIDPPVYSDWLPLSGLLTHYPDASREADDPDQDGLSNYAEMLAGTDPTDRASVQMLESVPRPVDLTESDQTPLAADQHAIYFRTVPGKQYGIQWTDSLDGPTEDSWWSGEGLWRTEAVVTATTTQKRFVVDKHALKAFYRILLAQ